MRNRPIRFIAGVAAVVTMLSLFGVQTLHAENESPVQVTGTVKDSTGKLTPGVIIKLFKVTNNPGQEIGGRGGSGGGGGKRDAFGTPETIELQGNKFGQMVGTATTDQNGAYIFKSVKPGSYRYMAGNPRTTGYAGGTFDVAAGQNMTLEIQLQPPQK